MDRARDDVVESDRMMANIEGSGKTGVIDVVISLGGTWRTRYASNPRMAVGHDLDVQPRKRRSRAQVSDRRQEVL